MAVEASISKFKKNNLKIYIVLCICLAGWCIYDGYFNEGWIEEHTNADGSQQAYLVVNRNAPPYLIGAAVLLAVYLLVIRNRKIITFRANVEGCRKKTSIFASATRLYWELRNASIARMSICQRIM